MDHTWSCCSGPAWLPLPILLLSLDCWVGLKLFIWSPDEKHHETTFVVIMVLYKQKLTYYYKSFSHSMLSHLLHMSQQTLLLVYIWASILKKCHVTKFIPAKRLIGLCHSSLLYWLNSLVVKPSWHLFTTWLLSCQHLKDNHHWSCFLSFQGCAHSGDWLLCASCVCALHLYFVCFSLFNHHFWYWCWLHTYTHSQTLNVTIRTSNDLAASTVGNNGATLPPSGQQLI